MRAARLLVSALPWLAIAFIIITLCAEFFGSGNAEISFVEPSPRLEGAEPDHDYELGPVLVNDSRLPIRLVGAGSLCGNSGCVSVAGLPVDIPAGARHRLEVHLKAGVPGRFSLDVPIYTDQPSCPTLILRVEGTVRDTRGESRQY